jgi:hypothetical protein
VRIRRLGCSSHHGRGEAPRAEAQQRPAEGLKLTQNDVDRLSADPDAFKGARVELTGQVFSVERDSERTVFQMWGNPDQANNNIVVVINDPDAAVREQQNVKVIGTVMGKVTGENALGGEVTAPTIDATSVRKAAIQDLDPPRKTLPGKSVTLPDGSTIRVSRVEFGRRPGSTCRCVITAPTPSH